MKLKKVLAVLLAAVLLMPLVPTAHAADILGDESYEEIARIHASNGCGIMQGMGIGEKYAYTAQINSGNTLAQVKQIELATGEVTTMTNAENGKNLFTYLSHANDMDVAEVNGRDWLFIAAGSKIYVFEVDNENAVLTERAEYNVWHNGSAFGPVGLSIYEINERQITFLFKGGYAISKGSIPIDSTAGDIHVSIMCMIDAKKVPVNGREMDISHYLNQGFDYRDGMVYAVFAGCSRKETINHSVIIGYDITAGKGTVYAEEVFYINSRRFTILFEMQSCGFTPDGQLWFCINGSYDGLFRLKDFTYSPEEENPSPLSYTVRFDGGAGAAGNMDDLQVNCGELVSFPKHPYPTNDRRMAGWVATRASDNAVFCVKKRDLSDAKWLKAEEMDSTYKIHVFTDGGYIMNDSSLAGDTVILTAQWEQYGDANGDGKLNIADVIALHMFLKDGYPLSFELRNQLDVNGDWAVDSVDVWTIFTYLAGAMEKLPVCE